MKVRSPAYRNFNPLPSREGRRCAPRRGEARRGISIHSPHARGDLTWYKHSARNFLFQSTPLTRGETDQINQILRPMKISIHSPHARGDDGGSITVKVTGKFQSTPLTRGETLQSAQDTQLFKFQSTPLTRGETRQILTLVVANKYFNPLPSCEGRRCAWVRENVLDQDFNPLPSCEGRRIAAGLLRLGGEISIHSPHARGDSINL